MQHEAENTVTIERYAPLGLIANPFAAPLDASMPVGVALEIEAAANRLLAALEATRHESAPRPILVTKTTAVPSFYHLRAIARAESVLANDDDLNVLHAYIQLYMMRRGRISATLGVVGERLAFRSFERTLTALVERVLEAPDPSLASFAALGEGGLTRLRERFARDPLATTLACFGEPALERKPELAEVADIRLAGLDPDAPEDTDSPEVDETIGDAPGTVPEGGAADDAGAVESAAEEEALRAAFVDYVIEHVDRHLSRVVARGLRVYTQRGLAALSTELRITKAPRKTLSALATLARMRFDALALIYDGFENWASMDDELRKSVAASLAEMRWMLDGKAVMVLLLEEGKVPELEEQFGGGVRIAWDFPHLAAVQDEPRAFDEGAVRHWLASAARQGASPLAYENPTVQEIVALADGDLERFCTMAAAAIEDAASRGASALDAEALEAARAAAVNGGGA